MDYKTCKCLNAICNFIYIPFTILYAYIHTYKTAQSNLLSKNLENFSMKGNLKYHIFSIVLLDSASLALFIIILLKYYLTDLSVNSDGYSYFCKIIFRFSRSM